jgi:hypothetical protein
MEIMADDLNSIDVSNLEGLAKLETDQRGLRALSEKAAWHRDKVVEVYSRVVRDYEARIRALDEQAAALREKVREDLGRLERLYAASREAMDRARVELQESEFRFEIGEFTREEFQKRQQAADQAIAECQQEFDAIGKMRARYLEIVPATPEPVTPPTPVPVPAPNVSQASLAPLPGPPLATPPAVPTPVDAPAPWQAAAPAVAEAPMTVVPVPASREGETSFMPPPSTSAFNTPLPVAPGVDPGATQFVGLPPAPGRPPAPVPGEPFGTIAVTQAMLVEDRGGLPGAHHKLGLLTTIGRTPDNQIVVPVREVSRKHAEIALNEGGYFLKDLGSPNGTFVNGQRVTEQRLEDGDRIGLGGQVFVFKAR